MAKPTLPQNDPDPKSRERGLKRAQRRYEIDSEFFEPIAYLKGMPVSEIPTVPWLLKAGEEVLKVGANSVAVGVEEIGDKAAEKVEKTAVEAEEAAGGVSGEMREIESRMETSRNKFKVALEAVEDAVEDVVESIVDKIKGDDEDDEEEELADHHSALYESVRGPMAKVFGAEGVGNDDTESTRSRGPSGRPSKESDYRDLFATLKLPDIAQTYTSDKTFARLRLQGANPTFLQGVSRLEDNFPVDDAIFKAAMGELDSIERAGEEGRLFTLDYGFLGETVIPKMTPKGEQMFLASPLALFAVTPDGRDLRPVAIQCEQTPDAKTNPIFTPRDGLHWKMARTVVQVADMNHHELIAHLGLTHMLLETFLTATKRLLSVRHPLYVLLDEHFKGSHFINNLAVSVLVAPGGSIDTIFAGEINSYYTLVRKALKGFDFQEAMIPARLARRKLDRICDNPYREDSLRLWGAIRSWVEGYVRHCYEDEAAMTEDVELRNWSAFLSRPWSEGGVSGFVPASCRADLIDQLTLIIHTASVEHAAVNFPQYEDLAFAPAASGALFSPNPTHQTPATEQAWLNQLTTLEIAKTTSDLLQLLSGVRFTTLGQYDDDEGFFGHHFKDPFVHFKLMKGFQKDLKRIEDEIRADNANPDQRAQPYNYLLPSLIPQSINI